MGAVIRKAFLGSIPDVRQIALTTWPVAYRDILSTAQLAYMLEVMYTEAALKAQFQAGHEFLVAYMEETAVGFASYATQYQGKAVLRIHKLYVLPDHQRMGIGASLLDAIDAAAQRAGASALNLNVNRFNTAKGFYLKHGFRIVRDEVIDIGKGYVMDDHVMERATAVGV